MRDIIKLINGIVIAGILGICLSTEVYAAPSSTIENGVFADDLDLSGMSESDAWSAIKNRVADRQRATITLTDGADYSLSFTGADIDYDWCNTGVVSEAASLGKSGNIVDRYMSLKDLQRNNQIYKLEYSINSEALAEILANSAIEYDREAVNTSMHRTEGGFDITDGTSGRLLNQEATLADVTNYLTGEWDGTDVSLNMNVDIVEPLGSYEDLSLVRDLLGTYTTSYSTSGSSRSANIANACGFINGTTLYPGQEFSTLDTITPFSEANGYFLAGSYLNGQVVDSFGGGICQVSTTLYNAVLLSELEVTERHNHSMIISYVKPSMDAAIAESSGKNFRFKNNTEYPIYIEGYTSSDKKITFNIYGVESRPSSHKVTYESETLSTDAPTEDMIYTDGGKAAGYSSGIQSAHIGYKARLWKNTYENGELVSREEINSSTYKKSPRSITIGVATDNPDVYNMLMEAAASGSADSAAAAAAQAAAIAAASQAPAEEIVETE